MVGEPATGKLPDSVVIGAAECGTTDFYHLLTRHPHVEPAAVKEHTSSMPVSKRAPSGTVDDPVDRAYSAYYYRARKGNEIRTFEAAIEQAMAEEKGVYLFRSVSMWTISSAGRGSSTSRCWC